ncbi:MAG: hypothetical protein L6W00_08345 [Lentisphaeria bacterium]|nr:MAG: hypothetical protein L6W00_08345 [Lentisphaeria bacterium]
MTERCIGLYYTRTPFYPKEITVSGEGQSGKYLYLLHAEGWEPTQEKSLGRIRFRYADGSTKWITLDSGKDCGNFWQPRNRPNAVVAWKGHNGTSPVGMYVTKIRTAGKPLRDITFQTAGNSSWLIAGMTLSNDSVPMYNAVPVVMAANSEWRPMQFFSEVIRDRFWTFRCWRMLPPENTDPSGISTAILLSKKNRANRFDSMGEISATMEISSPANRRRRWRGACGNAATICCDSITLSGI